MGGQSVSNLVAGGRSRGARLRHAFDGRQGLLCAVAAELLREGREQAEAQQLLTVLLEQGLLGPVREALAGSDPGAAAQVALVASRTSSWAARQMHRPSPPPEISEDELAELSEWLRALAAVAGQAAEASRMRTRARLALAWGKAAWFGLLGEGWLDGCDARVRANAVESLWGRRDAEAVAIFRRKLADGHQRVEANAAVGLYLAGESEAVKALWKMARGGEAPRLAAAAWAMGRTGDGRFLPLLAEMRQLRPLPVLAARAIVRAQERIRMAEDLPREELALEGRLAAEPGPLRVDVLARRDDGAPVAGLTAADFLLEVNGEPVWDYTASRAAVARPVHLCLAVRGRDAREAAARAAEMAVAAGLAGLVREWLGYAAEAQASGGREAGPEEQRFAGSLEGWKEMVAACARRLAACGGEKRLVVVAEQNGPAWLREAVAAAADACREAGAGLQVIREAGATLTGWNAGDEGILAPRGDASGALRRLADSWCDAWRLEVPGVEASSARRVRVVLRSGRYRGEAVLERG